MRKKSQCDKSPTGPRSPHDQRPPKIAICVRLPRALVNRLDRVAMRCAMTKEGIVAKALELYLRQREGV